MEEENILRRSGRQRKEVLKKAGFDSDVSVQKIKKRPKKRYLHLHIGIFTSFIIGSLFISQQLNSVVFFDRNIELMCKKCVAATENFFAFRFNLETS